MLLEASIDGDTLGDGWDGVLLGFGAPFALERIFTIAPPNTKG